MYNRLRERFIEIVNPGGLANEQAEYTILGADFLRLPSKEYALMKGKEVIVNCEINGFHGQAFTDTPKIFKGKVIDVADAALGDSGDRSIFFATLNAVMHVSGMINRVVHCKKNDAERCGYLLARHILKNFGKVKLVHIGYQPGHIAATSSVFDEIYVTDLNPENIGKIRFGVVIVDGAINEEIIKKVDIACITGSAIVNGTLFDLLKYCNKYGTRSIIYGITAKGAAKILGLDIFCPLGRYNL